MSNRKPKKPVDAVAFRIKKNINKKTLDLINEYHMKGNLGDLIHNALELYRITLEVGINPFEIKMKNGNESGNISRNKNKEEDAKIEFDVGDSVEDELFGFRPQEDIKDDNAISKFLSNLNKLRQKNK